MSPRTVVVMEETLICLPAEEEEPKPTPRPQFVPPNQLEITVCVPTEQVTRGNREFLTCFRCSGLHHFRSECSTWRTRICTRWQAGNCNEQFCAFAHGESQLRTPWMSVCAKVVRGDDGRIRTIGCGAFGHTINRCPKAGKVHLQFR